MPPKKLSSIRNALYVWDLTVNNPTDTPDEFATKLSACCKQWCFQYEAGLSETKHFQVRLNLKDKKRGGQIAAHLQEHDIEGHISATSNGSKGTFSYVMKAATRIAGPWSDRDTGMEIPLRIKQMKMRPWQDDLCNMLTEERATRGPDFDRVIWVIIDIFGMGGKSTFQKMMAARKMCDFIPPMAKTEDMLAAVMAFSKPESILVNLPRGYSLIEEKGFWTGCESIKDGYVYDKRHSFKHKVIDSPQLVVFTNHKPVGVMSADRWKMKLLHNGQLFDYSPQREAVIKDLYSKREKANKAEPIITDEGKWQAFLTESKMEANVAEFKAEACPFEEDHDPYADDHVCEGDDPLGLEHIAEVLQVERNIEKFGRP